MKKSLLAALALARLLCADIQPGANAGSEHCVLDSQTPTDATLQAQLAAIDTRLRGQLGMAADQAAAGLLDLRGNRLAMLHPDRIDYAASLPKIGILLAYFQLRPAAATNLDAATRHELGLMVKASDNALAAKFSRELGLEPIQQVLNTQGFYDASKGGGLWIGKHYGQGGERRGDPVADHSHAATIRQLLRFYLLMDQGELVSPEASKTMREIFASPEIPHIQDKFVKGLEGRGAILLRKSGWWEDWFHDSALVTGGGRHYILAAMTHHPKGDQYLEALARGVDDLLASGDTPPSEAPAGNHLQEDSPQRRN